MEEPKADMLFEASWEVCNKVGGIYTVVKSKAAILNEKYKNYYLVGPFLPDMAKMETQQTVPPEHLKKVFEELRNEGIIIFYGKWLIKGEPNVMLIDSKGLYHQKNDIKKWLWDQYGIDSLWSHWDFEEPMIWSYAVGKLLEKIALHNPNKAIVAQFHEWLSGFAALYLKEKNSSVKTVFTTHATMLGRSICGGGGDLYSMLDHINPLDEARRVGVIDKFTTERACAHNADVFTTVSEITGMEAEKLLGKKPDVLLLNGLDIGRFPTFEENSIKHRLYRDVIREFVTYYFFPYYTFDMDQTLIFFIVGRYEFKNKGIDIFIKALAQLNSMLRKADSKKTIITFFWIPTQVSTIRPELVENAELYRQIADLVDRNENMIKTSLISNIVLDNDPKISQAYEPEFMQEIRKLMIKFKKVGKPGLATHMLPDYSNDEMIRAFKANGLRNRADDKVKVIAYPVYLNGSDGLINLKYYDALSGCHLGVFPSYYEPWGYTPLEAGALGVPSVTTDLAGFGRFIKQKPESKDGGIYVIDRYGRNDDDAAAQLAKLMFDYSILEHKDRVSKKMLAKELSEYADWRVLYENYIRAHNLALQR